MNSINKKMSSLKANDIFEELIDENKKLKNQLLFAKKCLIVLNKFKTYLNQCFGDLRHNLNENNLKRFEELEEEFKEVFGNKRLDSETNCLKNRAKSVETIGDYLNSNKTIENKDNYEIKSESNEDIFEDNLDFYTNTDCISDENENSIESQIVDSIDLFNEDINETNEQMKCENIKKFICDFIGCGKQLKSKDSLYNHKRLVHTLEGLIYVCEFGDCGYKTANKDNFVGHSNRHKEVKPFECDYESCGKSFYGKRTLENHIKMSHTLNPFKCDLNGCDFKTKTRERLIAHKNRHKGINSFKCSFQLCEKSFASEYRLKYHIKYTHNMANNIYKCNAIGCDYKTSARKLFINHKNRHKGVKPFSCSYESCDKSFISKSTLNNHIRLCHQIIEKTIECNFPNCSKIFKCQKYLRLHYRKVHKKSDKVCDKYVCNEPNCDFRTNMKSNLKNHSLKHSNERPFNCDAEGCNKSFKSKYSLSAHFNMCHNSGITQIRCHIEGCDKVYKSERNLKHHLISEHMNSEYFTCDWPGCEYKTKHKQSLKPHQSVHKSVADLLCDWPECDKRFKTKNRLREHIRIHKSDKRYVCHWPGCQYRCVDSGNLQKHIKIHNKRNRDLFNN